MKYREKLFLKGNNVLIADEVKEGMIICLSNGGYFYVDDIVKEFISDEVAELYDDDAENIAPEHTVIMFIGDGFEEISEIPATAHVIAFSRIEGKHKKVDMSGVFTI